MIDARLTSIYGQPATLQAVNIRLFLLSCLYLFPRLALGAPAAKPIRKPVAPMISVDPMAKVMLQRAAKLYGSTAKWSGTIREIDPLHSFSPSQSKISIAFIRPNFIRIENRDAKTTILEMADGTTVSSFLQDPDLGNHATRQAQRRTLADIVGASMVSPKGVGELLASLLQGKTGILQSQAELNAQNMRSFQVKLLPSVAVKGQSYRRVQIEQRFNVSEDEEEMGNPTSVRYEHWFTPQGQLVKTRVTENVQVSESKTLRSDIVTQSFAPAFGASIFKFSPPQGAAKPKALKPVVSVEPKARQIFARAAEFYGKLSGLRLAWTIKSVDLIRHDTSTERRKLAWERRGRLRLENPDDPQALTLIDGRRSFTVEFGFSDEELEKEDGADVKEKVRYQVKPVENALNETLEGIQGASATGVSTGQVLANFLQNINDLTPEKVAETASVDGFLGLRGILLLPQPFGGDACDLVRVTWTGKSPVFAGNLTEQETLWFSRQDGRLMRVQIRSTEGKERNESHDVQITQQEFNPPFGAATFVYLPPKGAVLEKSTN